MLRSIPKLEAPASKPPSPGWGFSFYHSASQQLNLLLRSQCAAFLHTSRGHTLLCKCSGKT